MADATLPARQVLDPAALDQLFRTARSYNAFSGEVSDDTLHQLYDLLKYGPTAANTTPARFVFVRTPEAKAGLLPLMDEGNRAKTGSAPVTAIIGFDEDFHEKLPYLFPHTDAKAWFDGPREDRHVPAFRNGSLQVAYFILAARAVGLDAGPMSGFDNAGVDAEFFGGTAIKSNVIVNIGRGDAASIFPRSPRLSFDEACRIL